MYKEHLEEYDPGTVETIREIARYNGTYVAGQAVGALRHELQAREAARPRRKRRERVIIDSTVSPPDPPPPKALL